MNCNELNQAYAIDGQLEFVEGPGGLIQAHIDNGIAKAVVATYAAQVLSFIPAGAERDLMFVSEKAHYAVGKATKGGVPVCWPWFGPDPEDKGRPGHGFVRNRQWDVVATGSNDDGTMIELGVDASDETRAIWPHEFKLRLRVSVGSTLKIELITENLGDETLQITQALHTYFRVGDIDTVAVTGLDASRYIDKVDASQEKTQSGDVRIDQEVDRVYLDVDADLAIHDPTWNRRILISSENSRSAIVWNPWIEKAAAMGDFDDAEYKTMVCVETANAGEDVVSIAPGAVYTLGASYSLAD